MACGGTGGGGPAGPEDPPVTGPCPAPPAGAAIASAGTLGSNPAASGTPRIVLMGGSAEVDPASKRFVEAAGGGDVLVLRATGSVTSYNDYFRTGVGASPTPASVTSIRLDDPGVGDSGPVLCHLALAQAVWLAGGNQWNYLGVWPPALQDSIAAVGLRGGIGGTSAGAAALGEFAFDARHGGVTSEDALADPFDHRVQVSRSPLGRPELAGYIVDQHFRQRDREGRLLVFLARMQHALERDTVFGVGLDERAALVIDDDQFQVLAREGRAAVFYRTTRRAELEPGQPLDMAGVERITLEDGAAGPWPLDFDAHPAVRLRVDAGVVRVDTTDLVPGATTRR